MPARLPAPKRPQSLAEKLVGEFTREIRQARWRAGDRLPTEAEVVRKFGVSRTVVREALSQLQAAGLVETRHGIGTFVTVGRSEGGGLKADAAEIATVVDLLAMLELRISVESEAAAIAARRRSDAQLATMRSALDDFASLIATGGETEDADFRFHAAIAEATGNRYFISFLGSLGTKAIPRAQLKLPGLRGAAHHDYLSSVNREHEDIYNAIAREDPDGARAAMRTHIGNGRERLKQRQEGKHETTQPRRREP